MQGLPLPLLASDTVDVTRAGHKEAVGVADLGSAAARVNRQTGVAYTIQASDCGKIIAFPGAAAVTVTAPTGLGRGFLCTLVALGAGGVTVAAGGGASVNAANGGDALAQYAVGGLFGADDGVFVLYGDVTAP